MFGSLGDQNRRWLEVSGVWVHVYRAADVLRLEYLFIQLLYSYTIGGCFDVLAIIRNAHSLLVALLVPCIGHCL
jgi:hypothetical protein